jgi:glycosyltransferase involved in cell wall biosynthesis
MDSKPVLSVIVPAYNVKSYISQAVESALSQSLADLEVIVVDDGSTDGTMETLRDIADPRLRRIHKTHAGLAAARNTAIGASRGAFIGLLDGDDLWSKEKAKRHIRFLRSHPEIDLTFSCALNIDESGLEISPRSDKCGVLYFRDLLTRYPHCSAVFRREVIERAGLFDESLAGAEDLDLWLRIALQRYGSIYCIPDCLASYRRRKNQLTADLKREQEAWQQLLHKFSRLAPDEICAFEKQANRMRYRYYSLLAYEQKEYHESCRLLLKSLRHSLLNSLRESETWSLAAAITSGAILPDSFHQFLRRWTAVLRHRLHGNRRLNSQPSSAIDCRPESGRNETA